MNKKPDAARLDSKQRSESETASDRRMVNSIADPVLIRSVTLTGMLLILILYTLREASAILIPITLAYILNLLLSPLVKTMRNLLIPEPLGAGIVVLAFMAICAAGFYSLSTPAQEWMEKRTVIIDEIREKIKPISEPLTEAKEVADEVENIATSGDEHPLQTQLNVEVVTEQSLVEQILTGTSNFIAKASIVIILLYFLLAEGDSFLNKLVSVMTKLEDKKRAVKIMRDIQRDTSVYLLTRTLINILLGIVVALTLYSLNMPNPLLWGVMAGILNYAPYIGPLVSIIILTPVAILSFDSVWLALLVPSSVFLINVVEGQILTPMIIGKRLSLSPVVVFIAVVFWGWIWGIVGALIAIPITAAINVVCQHIEPLKPISDFIGLAPKSKNNLRRQQSAAD